MKDEPEPYFNQVPLFDSHTLTSDSHEVLYRQGLLKGIRCLDPAEGLSPGQMQAIDRVYKDHPDLHDDEFVRTNLDRWLS